MRKEKKEKITYIDDGRTIADMSAFTKPKAAPFEGGSGSRFKDIWHTYWDATKMMLLPTLVAAAGMAVIFGILYLMFTLA